jgi:hypothetical protein
MPETAVYKQLVKAYAASYGIAPETLWGVYGTESDYGRNLGPSSAGAVGPFQFLPSTAASMHVNPNEFNSAARGAAHYLHNLGANKDPNSAATAAALNRYSGGGGDTYINSVKEKGKTLYGPGPGPVRAANEAAKSVASITDPITAPIKAADDIGEVLGNGIQWLTSPSSWLRVGKGALGFTLITVGVAGLTFIIAKPVAKTAYQAKSLKGAVKSIAA